MKSSLICIVLALSSLAPISAGKTAKGAERSATKSRESRIPVGTFELYSRDVGQGPAMIVVHGGPDFDHSYLLPEMDRFADEFHLIYYDQRGRGRSGEHVRPEDVTLASDIDDIDKVRQYFHLESEVLLGHSWGTVLALEYALRYPERVSALILMNPAPASAKDYKQLRQDWMEKRAEDVERKKTIMETAAYKDGDPEGVTAYYRIHFRTGLARHEDYEKLIARLHASFSREVILKSRAIEGRLMSETWSLPDYDLLPKLKNLKVPTLVIYSDHEFIPRETSEHIAQAIPGARLVTLKDCGHFTYMECPEMVRRQIDGFMRDTAGRRK